MKNMLLVLAVSFVVSIVSFIFFRNQIIGNTIPFHTDEAYWVSTGKIVPMLFQKRLSDPFWHEYYGFTNFNGAKYAFGIGLALLGHTEEQIREVGVAPQTYYDWVDVDGKILPKNHVLYSLISDARIISAIFVSMSISVMIIFTYMVFGNILVATVGGLLLFIHPITQYVGTHAFADGIFLFFIMLFLSFSTYILRKNKNQFSYKPFIVLGFVSGYLISIKINAGVFLIAFGASFLLKLVLNKKGVDVRSFLMTMIILACSAIISFLVLHPNLFFFRDYRILQMLGDRIAITRHHIAYFSVENPDVVNLQLFERIGSLVKHIYPLWFIPLFLVGIMRSFIPRKKTPYVFFLVLSMGLIVTVYILSYVVFDEIRYFMPLLPFIILAAVRVFAPDKIENG